MKNLDTLRRRLGGWISPLVHLSNNWISLIGVVLVTTAAVSWLFALPISMRHEVDNPYFGILLFLVLPGIFFGGLVLIPAGIFLRFRKEHKKGSYPEDFPPVNFRNIEFRRLLLFVGITTVVNVVIAGQASYKAVTYMDSVTFCGETCHTVMQPEFTAYQNSPHSRVECVACHIGPGASWFVRSKLSGVGQVFAVALNTYPRPIPTPVENLRPARDTCEACHWPQKFGPDRLRILEKFADDEANTMTKTVLLMRIGGGGRAHGIHEAHLGEGIEIYYAHADESRMTIPWVQARDGKGRVTEYFAADAKPEDVSKLPVRLMDCVDCHNRPTHVFELPERAMDHALSVRDIPPDLPYIKKTGVELLKKTYASRSEAAQAIPAAVEQFYRENYPSVYAERKADTERAAQGILAIYNRNVFPEMKITWGTYPNHIGHVDFPGCFRCHDDVHSSKAGKTIHQDCSACHQLLAMEDPAPEILTQLGLTNGQ